MTTEDEIDNLKLVFEMARDRHPEVKDCIIAGDMNADLHYVKDPEALQLYKDPKVSAYQVFLSFFLFGKRKGAGRIYSRANS